MKKIIAVLLIAAIALTVSGCGTEEGGSNSSQTSNTTSEESSTVSSSTPAANAAAKVNEAVTILDKEDIPDGFPSPVSGTFNGQTISMGLVAVPEIDWERIDTYKQREKYRFYNGSAVLAFSSLSSSSYIWPYFYINKKGELIGQGYKKCWRFDKRGRALVQFFDDSCAYVDTAGKVVAPGSYCYEEEVDFKNDDDGVEARIIPAEDFCYKLYDSDGNLLNEEKFDHIGAFYKGLALIEKDYKIGLIDKKGNIVIEPSFPYDETEYPYTNWQYYPTYMDEDLAIIPINGKLGVLGITRSEISSTTPPDSSAASQAQGAAPEESSTVSSSSSSASASSSMPNPPAKITLSEAREIFDDFLTRLGEVRIFESTGFIERDTEQKIPGNPYYCLIDDDQIKGCKTVEDLKKLLNTVYSMRHINKFLLPKYIYGDNPYYMEYDGQLYIKDSTVHQPSCCEYDYDTFKIVDYTGDRLIIKCDRIYDWDDIMNGWWNSTEVLTLIRENDVWVLDQYGFIGVGFGDEDSHVGFSKDEWYD